MASFKAPTGENVGYDVQNGALDYTWIASLVTRMFLLGHLGVFTAYSL